MTLLAQPSLFSDLAGQEEDPAYLSDQLVTYIGNKRALLKPIAGVLEEVRERLGKDKLRLLDAFAGSGVVSRLFKQYASEIVSNDLENYSRVVSECYLTNRSEVDSRELQEIIEELNAIAASSRRPEGFIECMYAPLDEKNIRATDRVFYTKENARRLDSYRQLIDTLPLHLQLLVLGPLLSKASIHANTAGVFKGFYKDRQSGIGRFGGTGQDALSRICKPITLEPPVMSQFECEREVFQMDANALVGKVGEFDLAYLDPPYNQHPYGSNYFMLNLLVDYVAPTEVSRVSGIPVDWNRSSYNVRGRALASLTDLITKLDAKFVLISYNNEGFISPQDMRDLLVSLGKVNEITTRYNAFRGSRNLHGREIHVTEHLFILEKQA